jgi:pimeloyl-ACP methyl ester carboxylesterase
MRANYEIDVRHLLPSIHVPTLILHRQGDSTVPVECGRYLAEHIHGARYIERDSADHWPVPDSDLVGTIEEFITGSSSGARDWDRVLATVSSSTSSARLHLQPSR